MLRLFWLLPFQRLQIRRESARLKIGLGQVKGVRCRSGRKEDRQMCERLHAELLLLCVAMSNEAMCARERGRLCSLCCVWVGV